MAAAGPQPAPGQLSIVQLSQAVDYKLNQLFGPIDPAKPKDAEYVLAWNSGKLQCRVSVVRHTDGFQIQTVVRVKKLLAPDREDPSDTQPERYVFAANLPYIKAYGSAAKRLAGMSQEERRLACFKQVLTYLSSAGDNLTFTGKPSIL